MSENESRTMPVIVCTAHRGVFFGFIDPADRAARTIVMGPARMAIYFGTTGGVMQLAATGPVPGKSRIGSIVPEATIQDVTAVFVATDAAVRAWGAHPTHGLET